MEIQLDTVSLALDNAYDYITYFENLSYEN